ncbi:phosphoenolpyruvate--protein phosphotransferase [Photobacterium sp. SDRW27]|uniref:phosphoenolpyruvate--protein phosphotransferase n=1 Tax=Photobacterium obscurum TaxID=2829490 RepID=UPI002242E8DE|nr:phosphoenolpyruvate--protein phosphotransferase [Photobacterium obscurum]MCW8329204.1 phosphoenolpyruvate--protein phosphotransferase [Photobacterium obscurum]
MKNQIQFRCVLPNGIHARPASHLEKVCGQFQCQISLTNLRNGNTADAKSVLALVGTDTLLDDDFTLSFDGEDSQQAMAMLTDYINNEFPHCDEALDTQADDESVTLPQSLLRHQPILLQGKRLAPGIGKGVLVGYRDIDLNTFVTDIQNDEVTRFEQAHFQVCTSLEQAASKASGHEKEIITAHISIINDRTFIDGIKENLASNSTANAILAVVEQITTQLSQSSSAYLRERILDIRDVAIQLLTAAYPSIDINTDFTLTEPSIVIANDLTPSQFLGLDKELLQGLILTHAGSTSHTVILARAFNIPTLSGIEAKQCTDAINSQIYLDVNLGVVSTQPNEGVCRYFDRAIALGKQLSEKQHAFASQQAQTSDGKTIEIAANIACSIEAPAAFEKGAEGIGLFRTEMLFMDRSEAPGEDEQLGYYREVLEAATDKSVIIRTMDIGGDKPIDYLNLPQENNPFLGYRAVRIYPEFLALFHAQLRAILRAAVHGNAKIMIPMIQSIEEIRWVKEQLEIVKKQLTQEGQAFNADVPLGIMVEIPSVAFIVDQFCQEVDFFSIGSNDMTQYLLAVDRDNASVAKLYNSLAPAFLRMLNQVVQTAHQHGRWVGLCGELGADAKVLPLLIGAGLDEISMSAPKIAATKATLCKLNSEDCKVLFEQACQCPTIADVQALLENAAAIQENKPLLATECVMKPADFASKEEVIQAMVGNLGLVGRTDNAYKLEEDVWAREEVFSTGLGHGFAIPHTKSDNIRHSSISIAHLNQPIDWQSDSGDVDFIIMLTLNKAQGDQHMRIFSTLARKLIHQSFRDQLRASKDDAEIIAMLEKELAI